MSEEVLIIDPENNYNPEDGFHVFPSQLCWLKVIQKNSFDKVIIRNTPSSVLSHKYFFYINKLLKQNCICEVYVSQKIGVLQDLDAQELESNAKLGKFVSIENSPYEKFVVIDGKDVLLKTIRLTMMKD